MKEKKEKRKRSFEKEKKKKKRNEKKRKKKSQVRCSWQASLPDLPSSSVVVHLRTLQLMYPEKKKNPVSF